MLRRATLASLVAAGLGACAPAAIAPPSSALEAARQGLRPNVVAVLAPQAPEAMQPAIAAALREWTDEPGARSPRLVPIGSSSEAAPRGAPPIEPERLARARRLYRDLDFDGSLLSAEALRTDAIAAARTAEEFDLLAAAERLRAADLLALERSAEAERAWEAAFALRPQTDPSVDEFAPEVTERAQRVERAGLGRAVEVRVETAPAGAELLVDGRPAGHSPGPIRMLAGWHRVEARAPAHHGSLWDGEVTPTMPEPRVIRLALDPIVPEAAAVLSIRVEPSPRGVLARAERTDAATGHAVTAEAADVTVDRAVRTAVAQVLRAPAAEGSPAASGGTPILRSPWFWGTLGGVALIVIIAIAVQPHGTQVSINP